VSAKPKSGLGKGIDALISSDFDRGILGESKERIQKLFISEISPMEDQPRKHFDSSELDELSNSIERFGMLQPIIVTKTSSGYSIIAGERRWRAAQKAGLTQVPAIVREHEDQERLEIALIENVQRVDLSPLEQATSIDRLHREFGLSFDDIATRLGKANSTINNLVRLLQLPEEAKTALLDGKITEGHARAILSLKGDSDKQLQLLSQIVKNNWSVRQAEQFVTSYKQGAKSKKEVTSKMATTTPETEILSKKLGASVSVKRLARGGRLEIHFKDDKDLENIIKRLQK